jgi:hypothetical protein
MTDKDVNNKLHEPNTNVAQQVERREMKLEKKLIQNVVK